MLDSSHRRQKTASHMDSSFGLAWGRFASSHRRARSGGANSMMATTKPEAVPIQFTRHGTRYTSKTAAATEREAQVAAEAAVEAALSTSTPPPLIPLPLIPAARAHHVRSNSWTAPASRPQLLPTAQSQPPRIVFHSSPRRSHQKSASTTSPSTTTPFLLLDLHPALPDGTQGPNDNNANVVNRYRHKANTKSVSSRATAKTITSTHSITLPPPQPPTKPSFSATPPRRPPRPPRGLFDNDSDSGHDDLSAHNSYSATHLDTAQTRPAETLTLSRPDCFTQPTRRAALASVSASATPNPASHLPVVRPRRNSINSACSARSSTAVSTVLSRSGSVSSVKDRRRPTRSKKMGKRKVLLPARRLRHSLSQSVVDFISHRPSKIALQNTDDDALDPHRRNSSITAAKRLSRQSSKRHSVESKFALAATHGRSLTASQMYHLDMLPNSVVAWMGTDTLGAQEENTQDCCYDEDDGGDQDLAAESDSDDDPHPSSIDFAANRDQLTERNAPGSSPPLIPLPPRPPRPPPKNPARFGARARSSHLSTILETPLRSPSSDDAHRRRKNCGDTAGGNGSTSIKSSSSKTDSLYVIGTAYSQTSPLFRHGHIEFHGSPKLKQQTDEEEGHDRKLDADTETDDHLDWPRFHMSALCDAGDLEAGLAQDEENLLADDLSHWFDEFGFESHGSLIKSNHPDAASGAFSSGSESRMDGRNKENKVQLLPQSLLIPSSTPSPRSSSSTISDADLPMPASPDRSSFPGTRGWTFGEAVRGRDSGASSSSSVPLSVPSQDDKAAGWTDADEVELLGLNTYRLPNADVDADGTVKQTTGAAAEQFSEPRMSCNLSQDLGQFLAWNPTNF